MYIVCVIRASVLRLKNTLNTHEEYKHKNTHTTYKIHNSGAKCKTQDTYINFRENNISKILS